MKKRIIWVCILIITFLFLIILSFNFYYKYKLSSKYIDINVSKYLNDNYLYEVNVNYNSNNESLLCSLDNNDWLPINDCKFNLNVGKYKIFLKNEYFDTYKEFSIKKNILGKFSSSLDKIDTYYLALNGKKSIDFQFDYEDDFDTTINWLIEDSSVLTIENNIIYGKNVGKTKITAVLKDGNTKEYNIVVTDLITPPTINNSKPYLPCENYSEEESILLDKILESRILEAGEGTRGGVLAAARFLSLEFPYSIRYFNENGRLVDHKYRPHIDGEGRYYHKGLYLSKTKYADLEVGASTWSGPKMWGCKIYDNYIKDYNMNGLTCSGFVTWAMLNGGFDVGDVGAGNYKEFNDDLSDLGKRNKITKEYIAGNTYKPGDFIASNGHAALIIGVDDENIYTAEALPPKLKAYIYDKENKIYTNGNVNYVIEMSDIYPNGDGYYTNMWE